MPSSDHHVGVGEVHMVEGDARPIVVLLVVRAAVTIWKGLAGAWVQDAFRVH